MHPAGLTHIKAHIVPIWYPCVFVWGVIRILRASLAQIDTEKADKYAKLADKYAKL